MIALVLKSTLVLALTAFAAVLLRRESAGLVHRIWMAGLIAAMSMPLINWLAPQWGSAWLVGLVPAIETGAAAGETLRMVWLGGAALGLGLMLAGAARLGWLVCHAEPLAESRWSAIAAELGRELGLKRPVQLLAGADVHFLGTWGILRPRVLVPTPARGWSERRVRAVLAHELAHVARGDWPVQMLADAARAIYWFNPLFWMLARRLRQESEHAADNLVLGLGIGQSEYARELLEISGQLGARSHQSPVLAMAQPSFLERRLVAVLNPKLKRVAAAPWATAIIVLIAIGVSAPLAMLGGGRADGAAAATADTTGTDCPVTPTLSETSPDPELTAAFGDGPWHVNDDRSIWVWAQPYVAGRAVSAIWIRPEGAALAVSGERLDADAPPLEATFDCCFPRIFKSGGIRFPTAGCWRVRATAGDRRLSFVTEVLP